jgi:hypothetical protein
MQVRVSLVDEAEPPDISQRSVSTIVEISEKRRWFPVETWNIPN